MFLANRSRSKFSWTAWNRNTKGKWRCTCFTDELDTPGRRGKAGLY